MRGGDRRPGGGPGRMPRTPRIRRRRPRRRRGWPGDRPPAGASGASSAWSPRSPPSCCRSAAINPQVLSLENLTAISMDAALLIIVAVAQILIIVTRSIDLSIASVIGLSTYAAASVMQADPALGIAAGLGAACRRRGRHRPAEQPGDHPRRGAVDRGDAGGHAGGVPRRHTAMVAGGKRISADQVPQAWRLDEPTSARLAGVPGVVVIAAPPSRWPPPWRCAGCRRGASSTPSAPSPEQGAADRHPHRPAGAGPPSPSPACWPSWTARCGRRATPPSMPASPWATELTVIAAVVVEGVAIRGGSGTVLGALLGALLLLVINNGLTLVRVDPAVAAGHLRPGDPGRGGVDATHRPPRAGQGRHACATGFAASPAGRPSWRC